MTVPHVMHDMMLYKH